jgi:hypothetical protein
MARPLPNRLALYIGGAVALLGALAPIISDADWESTAGIIAAIGAVTALVWKFLAGWQAYEQNPDAGFPELSEAEPIEDDFDQATATVPEEVRAAANADIEEGGTSYAGGST